MIKIFHSEIRKMTEKLIEIGLSVSQNPPIMKDKMILSWAGNSNYGIALKDCEYLDIYNELNENKCYNIKLLDGALIQIEYYFNKKILLKSRLAYFPYPLLNRYDSISEEYDTNYYGELIFGDIIEKHIITTPLRFDYSPDQFIKIDHPSTHLHLGQMEGCRIPLSSPITPNTFFQFILRNFYREAFKADLYNYDFTTPVLPSNIHNSEENLLHLAIK